MAQTRILLADDHAIVRAGIRKVVDEIPGLEVVAEVGDGAALFDCLRRVPLDCILVDVTMPRFEPLSAIQMIRSEFPQIKILVVKSLLQQSQNIALAWC